jgi:hypothetical protein
MILSSENASIDAANDGYHRIQTHFQLHSLMIAAKQFHEAMMESIENWHENRERRCEFYHGSVLLVIFLIKIVCENVFFHLKSLPCLQSPNGTLM